MSESEFKRELIKELRLRFPDCIILSNDANFIQGIPDVVILWRNKWAALECKVNGSAARRPNQEFYIAQMNGMSFAAFIYPANRERVLNDLQHAFGDSRPTRLPRPQ